MMMKVMVHIYTKSYFYIFLNYSTKLVWKRWWDGALQSHS